MKINTSRFGEIEIEDEELIHMADGLIGFPELTRFVLLNHEKDSPFKWLQSADDSDMAFIIISPLAFYPDYIVEVSEEEVSSLNFTSSEEAVISAIVTIPPDPRKMSANLKAPLVFNFKNRTGKQLILKDPKYMTKHFIMDEMKRHNRKDSSAPAEFPQPESPPSAKMTAETNSLPSSK